MSQQVHVIVKSEKNPFLGGVLGFFFGFIGLFYADTKAALIMLGATVLSACMIPLLIGFPMLFCCWVASGIWGYLACQKYNAQMSQVAVSHAETHKAA